MGCVYSMWILVVLIISWYIWVFVMIFVFDYFVECFFCGYVNRYRIGKNLSLLLFRLLC